MHETILVVLFFGLGLSFGSFATVLVDRLPQREHLLGRSRCPQCKGTLGVLQLIPLFSYLLLSGRCAACSAAIPLRYPLLEVGSALLFTLGLYLAGGDPVSGLLLSVTLWFLCTAAVIDAETQTVPDLLSLPFVGLSFLAALLIGSFDPLAPLLGAAVFGGQWLLSSRRWVGSADIILAIGIGFLVGHWQLMVFAICSAYILGALVAVALLLTKQKTRKDHIAFVPFLAGGTLLTLLVGQKVLGVLG